MHANLLVALKRAGWLDLETLIVDGVTVSAFGEATGPSPVERDKPGTEHTVMVDQAAVSPVIRTPGAKSGDRRQILPVILDFPRAGGVPGRPDESYPDRVHDGEPLRALLRWPGIEPHIAREGDDTAQRAGQSPRVGRTDDQLGRGFGTATARWA